MVERAAHRAGNSLPQVLCQNTCLGLKERVVAGQVGVGSLLVVPPALLKSLCADIPFCLLLPKERQPFPQLLQTLLSVFCRFFLALPLLECSAASGKPGRLVCHLSDLPGQDLVLLPAALLFQKGCLPALYQLFFLLACLADLLRRLPDLFFQQCFLPACLFPLFESLADQAGLPAALQPTLPLLHGRGIFQKSGAPFSCFLQIVKPSVQLLSHRQVPVHLLQLLVKFPDLPLGSLLPGFPVLQDQPDRLQSLLRQGRALQPAKQALFFRAEEAGHLLILLPLHILHLSPESAGLLTEPLLHPGVKICLKDPGEDLLPLIGAGRQKFQELSLGDHNCLGELSRVQADDLHDLPVGLRLFPRIFRAVRQKKGDR